MLQMPNAIAAMTSQPSTIDKEKRRSSRNSSLRKFVPEELEVAKGCKFDGSMPMAPGAKTNGSNSEPGSCQDKVLVKDSVC